MILTKEVNIFINNKVIGYYRGAGYDIVPNSVNCIKVKDLLKNSTARIDVKCYICGFEKNVSYQKYNKNIEKYNIYTCNSSCAQFKNKLTLKKLYGSDNFNRSEENKIKVKEKYDRITKEIEERGYINCSKCGVDYTLSDYLRSRNGRFMSICKICRDNDRKVRNLKRIDDKREKDRIDYRKNIHIHAWRQILKNYLNRKSLRKIDRTYESLKYSPSELKYNLEKKFQDGMNWENYGKVWQIDHIVHVSYFKTETPIHIANSLDNLRPLDAYLNISRNNKMDEDCRELMFKYKEFIKEEYVDKLDETYS
jgi:hypothetical protein